MSNYSDVPDSIPGSTEEAEEGMRAYDALPPRLRRLIDEAPFKLVSTSIERCWQRYGEEECLYRTAALIRDTLEACAQERASWCSSPPRHATP